MTEEEMSDAIDAALASFAARMGSTNALSNAEKAVVLRTELLVALADAITP